MTRDEATALILERFKGKAIYQLETLVDLVVELADKPVYAWYVYDGDDDQVPLLVSWSSAKPHDDECTWHPLYRGVRK